MAEQNSLNSIRAGIFVGTVIALALAVTFVLLKVNIFANNTRYGIDFTTTDGVAGLNKGSEVRVGGVVAGQVLELQPQIDESASQLKGIRVFIEVDSRVPLYWSKDKPESSARVLRVPSLLGNSASVNFISVGDPRSEQLKKDGVMMAMEGSGMLASLVGPDNADKAREILLNIAKTAEWMRITLPRDYDSNVGPMLSNLNATVAAFKDDYENWRKPIGTSITDAASLLNRTDRMLQENEPRINRLMDDTLATLANARSITGEFKDKSMPAVQKLLDRGADAAQTLASSLDQVQRSLVGDLPALEAFLQDSRQMAAQLKLAAIEVRHSPWKLLYQPKPGEVAHENLYDAARSFAMATDDMRVAGESLQQAVAKMPGKLESDAAFRMQVQREVVDAMARYEQAQRRLYDVLNAPASTGGEGQ